MLGTILSAWHAKINSEKSPGGGSYCPAWEVRRLRHGEVTWPRVVQLGSGASAFAQARGLQAVFFISMLHLHDVWRAPKGLPLVIVRLIFSQFWSGFVFSLRDWLQRWWSFLLPWGFHKVFLPVEYLLLKPFRRQWGAQGQSAAVLPMTRCFMCCCVKGCELCFLRPAWLRDLSESKQIAV